VKAESTMNGSAAINGLKAEHGQVIDLQIHDDSTFSVTPGGIDTLTIKKTLQSLAAADRQHYYYINAVTISTMRYRIYTPTPSDTLLKTKGVFISKASKSKPKKIYSSTSEKTEKDQVISMELVPVDDIINPKKSNK